MVWPVIKGQWHLYASGKVEIKVHHNLDLLIFFPSGLYFTVVRITGIAKITLKNSVSLQFKSVFSYWFGDYVAFDTLSIVIHNDTVK